MGLSSQTVPCLLPGENMKMENRVSKESGRRCVLYIIIMFSVSFICEIPCSKEKHERIQHNDE